MPIRLSCGVPQRALIARQGLLEIYIYVFTLERTGFVYRGHILETRRERCLRAAESRERLRDDGAAGAHGREALEHHRGPERSLQGELDPLGGPRGS